MNSQKKPGDNDAHIPLEIANILIQDYAKSWSADELTVIRGLQQTAYNMMRNPFLKWSTDSFPSSSTAIEGDIKNINNTCDANLGSPHVANCLQAAFEFEISGPVVLKTSDGPLIKVVGNCAIAVGFQGTTRNHGRWSTGPYTLFREVHWQFLSATFRLDGTSIVKESKNRKTRSVNPCLVVVGIINNRYQIKHLFLGWK